jgi:WD40 repeat protein/uncharacterized caspase-like protein
MRFSRGMAWLCGTVIAGLSATSAASQTTQHTKLMVQAGGNYVWSVVLSSDGRRALTGTADGVLLWDVETGKELRSFEGHWTEVWAVAFSPDGSRVLTGGADGTARVWDFKRGKELHRFKTNTVTSVAFSPDGRRVLTGSEDCTARLWDVETGKELHRFGEDCTARLWDISETPYWVFSVAFSRDGRKVLTGSGDSTARMWDVETGKELRRFEGNSAEVTSVVFSPDGHRVLTGSADRTVRLWDAGTAKELRRFEGHSGEIACLAFSRDGRKVLTGGEDKTVRLWDEKTGKELRRFEGHSDTVAFVAFSPDGRRVLTGGKDNTARLWDEETGKELQRFQGNSGRVSAVAFSPDGRRALTGSLDNTARLWDLEAGKELHRFEGHSGWVYSVAFSPDGGRVLTGSADKTARLWDVETGKELQRFEGHSDRVYSVAFSPDGHWVLTGSADKTARLWDVNTGKQLHRFGGFRHRVSSVAFWPNGLGVLTGGEEDAIYLEDIKNGHGEAFGVFDVTGPAALSPDGERLLAATTDNAVVMWDTGTGTELRQFKGHTAPVSSLAFSSDGRMVLTGSLDGTARLWDTETGKELQRFEGHSSRVSSVAFSPDDRRVLTGSPDGTARLWNSSTGTELASLVSFTEGGWAVVDPEGRYDTSDPNSSSSLYWVTDNLRTINLGQLTNEYYTPGLLARVMRGERLPDVTGMNTVALPPELSVASGFDQAPSKLQVNIENDGGGVGKLIVKVNDRLLQTVERPGMVAEGKSVTLSIDLGDAPFVAGDNTIRITAYDESNRIESHPLVAHYAVSTPAPTAKGSQIVQDATMLNAGKFYAIVVGTSTFGGPDLPNLTFPAKDAESFATGIRLGAERLYGKDNVWMRVLTTDFRAGEPKTGDGLPIKQNIRAAFDEVRRAARPEDTLVVYLSGHGAMSSTNRDLYYYLTMDARTFDIERDVALKDVSTVSSAELFEWLREPVKTMPLKQVVILDTCAAGGASNDLMKLAEKRDIPPDQRRAIELLKDATGTFILMGSAADSVSYEASKYGEGLLTYALLQGMRGESLDDGSRLGVNRWFEKASEDVPDLAKSIGGIQKPVIAAPKGTGFPVALLTAEDRAKIPLATIKQQLLRVLCENEDQGDPLDLQSLVREQMRAINYAQARGDGSPSGEATVMYLDDTNDGLPDALAPKLRYVQNGDRVGVRVKLVSQEKTIPEQTVTGSASDKQALAKKLAETIVAMAIAKP